MGRMGSVLDYSLCRKKEQVGGWGAMKEEHLYAPDLHIGLGALRVLQSDCPLPLQGDYGWLSWEEAHNLAHTLQEIRLKGPWK